MGINGGSLSLGGGCGCYGSSGGDGTSLSGSTAQRGGSNGDNGMWLSSTTLPPAAGAAGTNYNGGNGGLVILSYFEPGATCSL